MSEKQMKQLLQLGKLLDEEIGTQLAPHERSLFAEDYKIADEADALEDYLWGAICERIVVSPGLFELITSVALPLARGRQRATLADYLRRVNVRSC